MHLAVVAEQLRAPVPGGAGRYTGELLRALPAAASMGERITEWYAPGAGGLGRARQPLLAELWRRGLGPAPRNADLVFAPTVLAPPRRDRPLIVTIHDAVPWTHPQTLTPRGARWHRAMLKRIAAGAAAVLTPTAAVAAELSAHLKLPRVEVVSEGISPAVGVAPPDAAARARRLELPPAYVLAVGTREPRKGLDVAAAAISDEGWPDLPLLVVGPSGWGSVHLPPSVRMLGRLTDPDLATVYAHATVLVAPSRAEGFGLPVLEAMAHGLPVVISDVPALVEVAAGAAIVVPLGDAPGLAAGVRRAVAERPFWSQAGKVRSADFSWEAAAGRIWDLCRDLLSTYSP